MSGIRAWLGREGRFKAECEALLDLLARIDEASLTLRTGPAEGFRWILDPGPAQASPDRGNVTIFTSGTTGEPKPVTKAWRAILDSKRGQGAPADRWLLTYSPARWAGLSVLAHCLKHQCRLVFPDSLDIRDICAGLRACTHVSLTPSLFRKAMVSGVDLTSPGLRQVTFGGEAATQAILTQAHAIWPAARISHVYASTEFGDLVACSDGLEGFVQLPGTLDESGELHIGGQPSGDLWKLENGRHLYLGRKTDVINVGGAKVAPFEVEKVLNSVPGVVESRVFGTPSPLLGALVCAEYRGTIAPVQLALDLRKLLPKYAVPVLTRVDDLQLTDAGKVGRA